MGNYSPLTAKYLYNLLDLKQSGDSVERLGATLFNSHIKLTPHQIEAALFAFKTPLSKGCILADEVGLGKTIEAGIVLAQYWSEKKRKIIIVCPASLMRQWESELQEKFNLPSVIMDRKQYNIFRKEGLSNPFAIKDTIVICSYHMCAIFADDIRLAGLELAVIDEAHKLRNVWTGNNKISCKIKEALSDTKKLLLTATPIQNNVMDLYGLSSLIDDEIFGDQKIYKEKYQKEYSKNLNELRDRLSNFTHRTLREQVKPYIKFTKRIPRTYNFEQSQQEVEVYEEIRQLLLNSDKESYLIPNKQRHLLLLILCKLMGSSIHSIVYTLEAMRDRLQRLLETGIDSGLDTIIDSDDSDDEELYDDLDEEAEQEPIDPEKLKAEIDNLDRIIDLAKSVKVESKYIALKDAIRYGFDHLKELNANRKILIFTESRRTQNYLYDSLKSDGFSNVVLYNGSNNDDVSADIYKAWSERPENIDKLSNNKAINMREAIIDYFRDDGEILIATGAGAEGLNLQFCSMVVNYDLPWNPQVVEQRIGRCHRFGQKHDVAVVNFLSTSNVVEQRIYELLSTKFRVFNEIFGSSDAILGALEEGTNLQRSIIDIYTSCRTVDEINKAFDKIQEQYKDTIDESMKKTKRDLLENFDEDLQIYFADVLKATKNSVNQIEDIFWRLTKIILGNQAVFHDNTRSFEYDGKNYSLSSNEVQNYINYNTVSKLGKDVIEKASAIKNEVGNISFDITNYPYRITNIEQLKGKRGYISCNKVSIDSFEKEEKMFLVGFLEDGTQLDEETLTKLFRLSTEETEQTPLDSNAIARLASDVEQRSKKILIESEEKNNQLLNDEIKKINNWAEDKIESIQLRVEQMRSERKRLQRESDLAESAYEKNRIEEEILSLSRKIKTSWLELAGAEDEIEEKRRSMVDKLRSQMMKNSDVSNIFTASFEVI